MSRFLQSPRALRPASGSASAVLTPPQPPSQRVPVQPVRTAAKPGETQPTIVQATAFLLLCIYVLSAVANDWSIRFLGERAYFSIVSGVMLPVACLAAGTAFRGLRYVPGRWWLAFLGWAVVGIPFSRWPGGTAHVLFGFVTKDWILLFYTAAAVLTLSQVRRLFHVYAFGAFIVLSSCVFFGASQYGRFAIPGSIFFENPNDLALQLLISSMFVVFLLFSPNRAVKAAGGALFLAMMVYTFKTASRGVFVSMAATYLVALALHRQRLRLIVLAALVALVAAFTVSPQQWARMVYVAFSSDAAATQGQEVNGDLESQQIRTFLFKKSLEFTARYPITGLGAGEFGDTMWAEMKQQGKRTATYGTHNTYTEVSSELGIPGLICYLGTLFGAMAMNLRLYRKASLVRGMEETAGMAFCAFLALVGYATSTIFDHVTYGRQLPILAGLTIALWAAGSRQLEQKTAKTSVPAR